MKQVRVLLALALLLIPGVAFAQLDPVILEAEHGVVGSQFTIGADGATTYATVLGAPPNGSAPATIDRVITFTVTFPHAGDWELYARLRVGPQTFNDDSMFYANSFGVKNLLDGNQWVLANGLAGAVGYTVLTDKVTGGGAATSNVWKWVKLSAFDGGEPPVASFAVADGALTQTFQVAGREDGLWLDKFAFGPKGVFFTVYDLDNGLPGTTVPPPPPFVPTGPPIATGKAKFLGSVSSPSQDLYFREYFNQVTPENAGKWGSVEATRDVIKSVCALAGAKAELKDGYPGWMPNLDSPLLKKLKGLYVKTFGKEAEVVAVHAGLECGIIGEKFPGMDMISFGPTMKNPHSPEEHVHIGSVEKFWTFLTAAIDGLSS